MMIPSLLVGLSSFDLNCLNRTIVQARKTIDTVDALYPLGLTVLHPDSSGQTNFLAQSASGASRIGIKRPGHIRETDLEHERCNQRLENMPQQKHERVILFAMDLLAGYYSLEVIQPFLQFRFHPGNGVLRRKCE